MQENYVFERDKQKNTLLKKTRDISFKQIVKAIET